METRQSQKQNDKFTRFTDGSCAQTYLWEKGEETYVVKTFYNRSSFFGSYENERYALESLSDIKSVPKLYKIRPKNLNVDYCSTVFITMEYIEGPTLYDWLDIKGIEPTVSETKKITFELIEIIIEIHSKGFAHNDLKPENIMYNPKTGKIHIIDFGFSTLINEKKLCQKPKWHIWQMFGALQYTAPEHRNYLTTFNGIKSDTWNIGILIYVIYSRKVFWTSKDLNQMEKGIYLDPAPKIKESLLPKELENLLFSILEKYPEKRPSLEKILQDPWFDEIRDEIKQSKSS